MEIKKEIEFYIPNYEHWRKEPILVKIGGQFNDVLLFAEDDRIYVRVYSYNLKKYDTILDVELNEKNYNEASKSLADLINSGVEYYFECDNFYDDYDVLNESESI